MTYNWERRKLAMAAMAAYRSAENARDKRGILGLNVGENGLLRRGYPMRDLIEDLCHLMAQNKIDPLDMVGEAVCQYAADLIEYAGEHNDEWDVSLEDPDNMPLALEFLRINGVPEVYCTNVLVKVGLIGPDDPRHPTNHHDEHDA